MTLTNKWRSWSSSVRSISIGKILSNKGPASNSRNSSSHLGRVLWLHFGKYKIANDGTQNEKKQEEENQTRKEKKWTGMEQHTTTSPTSLYSSHRTPNSKHSTSNSVCSLQRCGYSGRRSRFFGVARHLIYIIISRDCTRFFFKNTNLAHHPCTTDARSACSG
jgi:hypothetical protein